MSKRKLLTGLGIPSVIRLYYRKTVDGTPTSLIHKCFKTGSSLIIVHTTQHKKDQWKKIGKIAGSKVDRWELQSPLLPDEITEEAKTEEATSSGITPPIRPPKKKGRKNESS